MAKKKYGTQSKGDADPDYVEEEIKSGSSGGYVKKLRKKRRKKSLKRVKRSGKGRSKNITITIIFQNLIFQKISILVI